PCSAESARGVTLAADPIREDLGRQITFMLEPLGKESRDRPIDEVIESNREGARKRLLAPRGAHRCHHVGPMEAESIIKRRDFDCERARFLAPASRLSPAERGPHEWLDDGGYVRAAEFLHANSSAECGLVAQHLTLVV